ncbi:MAG: alpha-L-fucosidase, partial [Rhodothermales bacterium]
MPRKAKGLMTIMPWPLTLLGWLAIAFVSALPRAAEAQDPNAPDVYTPDWESLTQHPTSEWFRDAKFGIYFHWGPYSVPA